MILQKKIESKFLARMIEILITLIVVVLMLVALIAFNKELEKISFGIVALLKR